MFGDFYCPELAVCPKFTMLNFVSRRTVELYCTVQYSTEKDTELRYIIFSHVRACTGAVLDLSIKHQMQVKLLVLLQKRYSAWVAYASIEYYRVNIHFLNISTISM